MIYYFKGKPYEIFDRTKIKMYDEMGMNGYWEEVVIYKTLYHNPDGKYWVRFKNDFFANFKTQHKEL